MVDLDSVPALGRSPEEGNLPEEGYTLQYSCLENMWTEEPRGLQSTGSQRVSTTERLPLLLPYVLLTHMVPVGLLREGCVSQTHTVLLFSSACRVDMQEIAERTSCFHQSFRALT